MLWPSLLLPSDPPTMDQFLTPPAAGFPGGCGFATSRAPASRHLPAGRGHVRAAGTNHPTWLVLLLGRIDAAARAFSNGTSTGWGRGETTWLSTSCTATTTSSQYRRCKPRAEELRLPGYVGYSSRTGCTLAACNAAPCLDDSHQHGTCPLRRVREAGASTSRGTRGRLGRWSLRVLCCPHTLRGGGGGHHRGQLVHPGPGVPRGGLADLPAAIQAGHGRRGPPASAG
ncbi:hypothetical protein MTO96_050303 [Rhipicephalus appendiculatus]